MDSLFDSDKKNYLDNIDINDIKIKDFRKLKAYELAIEFYDGCLEVSKKYKFYQRFLTDQLLRSASKIPLQIAEGNTGLHTRRECYFLTIALGSLGESQANLDMARVSKFIEEKEFNRLDNIAEEIKKLLVAYIRAMLEKINNEKDGGR
ncbi:four helix bundle protein [Clostridium sp.]|uniref:four helix bundle protein n=1 Tax=Clostridium sp. TaxID=1506 RepID=UPI002914AAD5|nr:four helix bundle protein [Clostridium sp.]MDU5108532.1 four helix bundle protein [Clostridium sp.]